MELPFFRNHQIVAVVDYSWGDNGKGKLVDLLCEEADLNIRGTGGANAGHTVNINGKEYITHLLPAGIIHAITNIMGRGMVIKDDLLIKETKELEAQGIPVTNRLIISKDAYLTTEFNLEQEKFLDNLLSIGTTQKAIGPTYAAKVNRFGILMGDLFDTDLVAHKVKTQGTIVGATSDEISTETERILENSKFYKDLIRPTDDIVRRHFEKGDNIVLEGAQGTLLDLEFGTYPMATSSVCSIRGLTLGCDMPPEADQKMYTLGVVKAYQTRVGNGPFPTEYGGQKSEKHCDEKHENGDTRWVQDAEIREYGNPLDFINSTDPFMRAMALRHKGGEFGATTKRPRRTGPFDSVATKYAMSKNSPNLAVMKLDVLDGVNEIDLATRYKWNFTGDTPYGSVKEGQIVTSFPREAHWLSKIKPAYEHMPGWSTSTRGATSIESLPDEARDYVNKIAESTGGNVVLVSTGPERNETIIMP
tara:strand:- start:54 stop:1478 length:1425 start_codon:yes stop_codon:yes gene_type:complete